MMDHDRQYLIELDGNLPLATIFEQLMIKLDTYSVRRAVVPIRLQSNEEEELPDEIDSVRFFVVEKQFGFFNALLKYSATFCDL